MNSHVATLKSECLYVCVVCVFLWVSDPLCGQRPVLCKASGLEYDWVSDPLCGQRPVLCKASGLEYDWVSDFAAQELTHG